MSYAQHFNPARTPQTEQASPLQVKNSAGGFTFQVDDWTRLERFLILGAEGGSYYASERELTRANAAAVLRCLEADPVRTVTTIAEISESGRAPKNEPAIFALALAASGTPRARAAAYAAVSRVCRIGTHLFHFVAAVDQMRGWGRGLRRAVSSWYTSQRQNALAFQVAKYGQRDGWSHADVLALCHATSLDLNPVLRYAVAGFDGGGERFLFNRKTGQHREYPDPGALPDLIHAFEEAKNADEKRLIQLIADYGLTHEMIPTQHKNSAAVWEALLARMPMTAMIRSLAKMTAVGLLKPLSKATGIVAERLQDREKLSDARVHPIQMLSALVVYQQGHGERGSLNWKPCPQIINALDAGFYESFGAVEASGKRTLLAFDVSGSMEGSQVSGVPGLTARTASAAMGMVTARVEPNWHGVAFTSNGWRASGASRWGAGYPACLTSLTISPRQRIDDVVRSMASLPMGGTDCALPMMYAQANKIEVDTFVVYTDNETWAGAVHPFQALRSYRQAMGIPARLAVVSMEANEFTLADPDDAGMLDVIGFDTNTPALLSAFSRGEV